LLAGCTRRQIVVIQPPKNRLELTDDFFGAGGEVQFFWMYGTFRLTILSG